MSLSDWIKRLWVKRGGADSAGKPYPSIGIRIPFRLTGSQKVESVIFVKRKIFTDISTISEYSFDNESLGYMLEDTVRKDGVKVAGQTAIPSGRYEVVVNFSNRFQKYLPLLLNVPNFTGVRIHPGNRPEDTAGCLLPGKGHGDNVVMDSRTAFNELFAKIQEASKNRKVFLSIG